MIPDPKFDDIRPYNDSEIPAAMWRIATSDTFPVLSSFMFPDKDVAEVRRLVSGITTCEEFQREVMWYFNKNIIDHTVRDFSYSGIENVSRDYPHLFLSNHRDIVMDACALQNILFENGYETSEISFGENLMKGALAIDIGKSNKMYKVARFDGSNMMSFYRSSIHLSEYIRYVITELRHSVWIAHRNGRTKDGNDTTDQGIIKMLGISSREDKISALTALHIIPVAVSYEWEPCDIQKALELYQSRKEKYVKKPGEDLASILSGISSFKGDMHISILPEISEDDLSQYADLSNVDYHKAVALLVDERIHSGYRLFPNNFIAHDIRFGKREFSSVKYNEEQYRAFIAHMRTVDTYEVEEPEILRDIFLGIYSNPVDNCYPAVQAL